MSGSGSDCFELLVAYVDGQLNRDEREYLLALLERDPELNRRVWQLRQMKDMVAFAYEQVAVPPDRSGPPPPHRTKRWTRAWVAIWALVWALGYGGPGTGGSGVRKAIGEACPIHCPAPQLPRA